MSQTNCSNHLFMYANFYAHKAVLSASIYLHNTGTYWSALFSLIASSSNIIGYICFDQEKTEYQIDKIQRNKKDTIVLTISFGIFASKHALLFSFFKYPIHIILSFSHPYLNP